MTPNRLSHLFVRFVAFAAIVSLGSCGAPPNSSVSVSPPSPKATHAELPTVEEVSVSDLQAQMSKPHEKWRVVNFWATWCGPCVAELPMLRDLAKMRTDVSFVLVNLDPIRLRESKVRPFLQEHGMKGLTHVQLSDQDPTMALRALPGWPDMVPVTYVISSSGVVHQQFSGAVSRQRLEAALPP